MDGAPPRLTLPSIGTRKAEEETSAINADEDKAAKEASEVSYYAIGTSLVWYG